MKYMHPYSSFCQGAHKKTVPHNTMDQSMLRCNCTLLWRLCSLTVVAVGNRPFHLRIQKFKCIVRCLSGATRTRTVCQDAVCEPPKWHAIFSYIRKCRYVMCGLNGTCLHSTAHAFMHTQHCTCSHAQTKTSPLSHYGDLTDVILTSLAFVTLSFAKHALTLQNMHQRSNCVAYTLNLKQNPDTSRNVKMQHAP